MACLSSNNDGKCSGLGHLAVLESRDEVTSLGHTD